MSSFPLLNNPLIRKIRRPLGKMRRWLRARPARTMQQRDELLADQSLSSLDRELLARVETKISPDDGMYRGDGDHYYRVGLSAIHCIDEALIAAKIDRITSALDLPCGHGRVLRFLVKRFPGSKFAACDLDRDGVNFCTMVIGAEPLYSRPNLREVATGRTFDLIWCGSLVTHLDDKRISTLFDFFSRHLAPGGLVVFTAAGERVAEWMATGEFDYGIERKKIPVMTTVYQEHGYSYTDYPYMPDYGISLTSPEWIRDQTAKIGGLREVYFKPYGWDNHQDVFAFVKDG